VQRYGVPSYIVSWLANFLTDRTQAVVTHAGTSIKLAITRSIVHGSGIGSISFVAYIGDLRSLSGETRLVKFADDLTLVTPAAGGSRVCKCTELG